MCKIDRYQIEIHISREIPMSRTAARLPPPSAIDKLISGRCRVYVMDVPSTTGLELHLGYTPCEWEHNQFGADDVLRRHLANGHPWLVRNPQKADVVLLTGHGFDRWCVAQTTPRSCRMLAAATRLASL